MLVSKRAPGARPAPVHAEAARTRPHAPTGNHTHTHTQSKGTRAEMKPDPNWVVQTTQEKEQKACIFSQVRV